MPIYRSDDASAPTLTGQEGSLKALLDAVLIDGYGGKTAAGWTRSYNDTNRAIYRNDAVGGSGTYYELDDRASKTDNPYVVNNVSPDAEHIAILGGYESVSGFFSGSGPFPDPTDTGFSPKSGSAIYKSYSLASAADTRAWVIFADAKTCVLFIEPYGIGTDITAGERTSAYYFGDYESYINSYTTTGVIYTNSDVADDYDDALTFGHGGTDLFFVQRDAAGNPGAFACGARSLLAGLNTNNGEIGGDFHAPLTFPDANGVSIVTPYPIFYVDGNSDRLYIGEFRGVRCPWVDVGTSGFPTTFTNMTQYTIAGETMYLVGNYPQWGAILMRDPANW